MVPWGLVWRGLEVSRPLSATGKWSRLLCHGRLWVEQLINRREWFGLRFRHGNFGLHYISDPSALFVYNACAPSFVLYAISS
jgi:hypothetical protein